MREIRTIVIHCAATPNGKMVPAATIHEWHLQRGWDGIGYSKVIQPDGAVEEGRPDYWVPSQVRGQNKYAIGICLVGTDKFPQPQRLALLELCKAYVTKYPEVVIRGHYEYDKHKTCPNFDVAKWCLEHGLPRKA